jgi:hypothetical protein
MGNALIVAAFLRESKRLVIDFWKLKSCMQVRDGQPTETN